MSHAINADSMASSSSSKALDVPHDIWKDPNPKSTGGRGKKQESSSPSTSSSSSPTPPPPPSPDKKKELIFKIDMYLRSPIFRKMGCFMDGQIKSPKESDSLESIEQVYQMVTGIVKMGSKRMMSRHMFQMFLEGGEQFGKRLLHLPCEGFSEFCLCPENIDFFQPELEEIAIEMSNALMPRPEMRILVKLFHMWKEFQIEQKLNETKEQLAKTGNWEKEK